MKITTENFFKTSDGAIIYYEDVGSGIPILMVPGFLCTTKFFCKNVEALCAKYRMITMDPRGQGNSSKSLCSNNMRRNALDIKELIDHLNLENVILLGWSVAASVVVSYAAEFNEHKLAGLALVDGSLHPFSGEPWNHHRGKDYNIDNWFATYQPLVYNPQKFYEEFTARISNHGNMPEEDRKWIMAECMKTMPWTAMEIHYDFCHTNNVPNLEKLKVPVAVFGSDSKAYGLDMVNEYMRRIPGYSETHEFYESGHLMFYYESEKFNNCLDSFARKACEIISQEG